MGYLLIDNKSSGHIKQEYDTKQCPHCGGIVQIYIKRHYLAGKSQLRQPKDEGYFCMKCMGPLCKSCGEKSFTQGCTPFMEELIVQQKKREQRRKLLELMCN